MYGLCFVAISLIGGFSLISTIPSDTHYILRQAYFLPFLLIAIPVFTQSFKVGLFKYFLQRRLFFVIFSVVFQLPFPVQITAILLFSINNYSFGLISLLFVSQLHVGYSSQERLMIGILFVFLITRINVSPKQISTIIIIMIFAGYFFTDEIASFVTNINGNAGWRIKVWVVNIKSAINETLLIGHGFGTTYFPPSSEMYVNYPYDRGNFVTGQHSSFVNVFYRMGIVGLLLFMAYMKSIAEKIRNYNAPNQMNYILLLGMMMIGVNVGLESPGYATTFVFLVGLVQYIISENYKVHWADEYKKSGNMIEQKQ
tara:strand:+ start:76 stop:1014 length:939 start_codon:yes stop_codon:yes gene_type:complete